MPPKILEAAFNKHLVESGLDKSLPTEAIAVMRMSFMAGALAVVELPHNAKAEDRAAIVDAVSTEVVEFGKTLKRRNRH